MIISESAMKTLINDTLAQFDDISVTMRSIEMDHDKDLQQVQIGLLTFVNALENFKVYNTLALENNGLPERFQKGLEAAIVEVYVILSKVNAIDIKNIKAKIKVHEQLPGIVGLNPIIGVLTTFIEDPSSNESDVIDIAIAEALMNITLARRTLLSNTNAHE